MKNLRTFKLTYIPVTDTKPARLRIIDTRFKKNVVITRGDGNQFQDDAITFLNKIGITVDFLSWNEISNETYLHTNNFETQIKGE